MPDIDSIRELLARGPAWIAEGQRLEAALAEAEAHHRALMAGMGEALAKREQAEAALLAWYGTPAPVPSGVKPGQAWPADVEAARAQPVAIEAPLTELFPAPVAPEVTFTSGRRDWCHWSGGIEGLAEAARSWSDAQLAEAHGRFTRPPEHITEARVIRAEQTRRATAPPPSPREPATVASLTEDGLTPDESLAQEEAKAKKARKKKDPPPPDPAFAIDCPRCRASSGEPCKNYKGQRKATCAERDRPVEAPLEPPAEEPVFPAWKDNLVSVDGPNWVLSVHEDQPNGVFEAVPLTRPFGTWEDPDQESPTPTEAEIAGEISRALGRPVEVSGVSWDCKGVPTFALRRGQQPDIIHYSHDASTLREKVREWSDAQIADELENLPLTSAEQLILLDEQMERRVKESKKRVSKKKASEPPKAEPVPPGLDDLRRRYPGALLIYRGHEWCRIPAAEDLAAAEELGIPEGFGRGHLDEHVRTLLAASRDVVVIDSKTGNEYPLFEWSVDGEFSVDVDGKQVNCLWRVKAQEDHAAGALVLTGPAGVFAPRGYLRVLVKKEDQYGHPETQVRVCVADFRSTQREEVPA